MSCVRFAFPAAARESAGSWDDSGSFGKKQLRRLENHGRALRIEHEHESLGAGWAGPRKWKALAPQCSDFVRAQLAPVIEQIRAAKAQLDRLSAEIEALVGEEKFHTAWEH